MAGRLPVKSGKEVLKALGKAAKRFGIAFKRIGGGDHVVLQNRSRRNFSVPLHDELAEGTLLNVINDAGMTKQDFLDYDP